VNLFAFLSFGPSIVQTLSPWTLWPLVVGAAIFSSHVFLLMSKGGACMGLSGVTLAFLAFVARLRPEQELGVLFMGIIPVRMPAQVALYALLAWSLLGSIIRKGRVAHSAHLGGLLFGMGYFELWTRRATVKRIKRLILRRGRAVVSGR
jgi:rhomboid-like protein